MSDDVTDLIALIDLDGTVADYDTPMQAGMNELRAPGEPEYNHRPVLDEDEKPYLKARRKLIQRQPGFWKNLECLPVGFQVVDELRARGFVLHVLSKGPRTTYNAWGEKAEWCNQHLPDALVNLSSDKSLTYGRVLVDDWPPYFEKWLRVRPRGLVIAIAHPWNADFARGGPKEHPNVLRYDGSDREELRRRLHAAYTRPARRPLGTVAQEAGEAD